MKIALITPVPAQSRQGNRVTALRWARILKALGHRVTIAQQYDGTPYELMVALHARRSFAAIACFQRLYPERPLIVALTVLICTETFVRARKRSIPWSWQ